jgi:hypothetical protein
MSRVRRQSLIVEEKKPKDACSWGPFCRVGTRRGGTRLTSAKLVGTSQNADSTAWSASALGLRCGVSGSAAPEVGTQSVPSHVHAPSQSGLFPQIFCQLCTTTSAAAIGQLGSRHQTVARGKMAQCSFVVVSHSLIRVDHQRKRNFCPEAHAGRRGSILWTHPFVFLASAWTCLRSMHPP